MAVRTAGTGGPGVLWLHGYTLDASIFSGLWRLLPGIRHVGIDLPGHGASAPLDVDRPTLAAMLAQVAHDLGARHIVGLSFGTILAIELAARYPGDFDTLTLGAGTFAGAPLDRDAQTRHLELLRLYRSGANAATLAERWMVSPPDIFTGARLRPGLMEQIVPMVEAHRWQELASGSSARLADGDQRPLLRSITASTLIVVGEDDMPAFKRSATLLTEGIGGARRTYLPGTGHLCLVEAPDVAAQLIAQHVTSHVSMDRETAIDSEHLSRHEVGRGR